jgi:hypothetical protein
MNKYKSHPLYFHPSTQQVICTEEAKGLDKSNLIYFASRHEFATYKALLPLTEKYRLEIHPTVRIISPNTVTTYPKGKVWKVDFRLSDGLFTKMLIEAKGTITRDFPFTLTLLELNNKELLDKLWLVFPSQVPTNNQTIKNLLRSPMRHRILTLSELKKQVYLRMPITQSF